MSLAQLAPDPLDLHEAKARRKRLRKLLRRLDQAGYAAGGRADVSLRLGQLGAQLRPLGLIAAADMAAEVISGAAAIGTRVTVEAEPELDQGRVIETVLELRDRLGADVAVALPAARKRTEGDCVDLVAQGVRVRLERGRLGTPGTHTRPRDINRAYVRCLQTLLRAAPHPVPTIATGDPILCDIAEHVAHGYGLGLHDVEYGLQLGMRAGRQVAVADRGGLIRVYLPFGPDWYPYLVERMAEKPAQVPTLLRARTSP